MKIYCIPGLATDHRLFDHLDLGEHECVCLDWPKLPEGSTIQDYAKKLADKIDPREEHALLGVSMGGMVAQELASMTHPKKLALISTWKGPQEMPIHLKVLRGTHPEKLITKRLITQVAPLMRVMRHQLGLETKESQELITDMMDRFEVKDIRAQVNAALNWSGPTKPVYAPMVRLHGERDNLMPISKVEDPIPIPGGTHVMVYSKGEEVSKKLRDTLGK